MPRHFRLIAGVLFVFIFLSPAAWAQTEFRLPEDPANWLNSTPITSQMLSGKAALLYFFEET